MENKLPISEGQVCELHMSLVVQSAKLFMDGVTSACLESHDRVNVVLLEPKQFLLLLLHLHLYPAFVSSAVGYSVPITSPHCCMPILALPYLHLSCFFLRYALSLHGLRRSVKVVSLVVPSQHVSSQLSLLCSLLK